ncbi:MAG: squalene--hopene cyclase [Terriglobia bacterium]
MAQEATKTQRVSAQLAPPLQTESSFDARLDQAVERAAAYLLSIQKADGYWIAELEADATLESDYILYLHILGKPDPERVRKLARTVRGEQLADGGWSIYAGGPSELNATIKAYFGLSLAGDDPASPHMAAACRRAVELGGIEATNSYTRFYLALCGKIPWSMVPAMPPELMLLPRWFSVNLYEMSSWTRGILVPLTILYALKPRWRVAEGVSVDGLFATPNRAIRSLRWDANPLTWRNFFLAADRLFKVYDAVPWKPLRNASLGRAAAWMLEHLERSDGLGAIYPAMLNSILALLALGYAPDHPLTARERGYLRDLEIEEEDSIRLQPCLPPVWDTCIAMVSLAEAGIPATHPALVGSARWLLKNQVVGSGDWQVKNRGVDSAGWAFEFRNDFYPDVDDTAFVLIALDRVAFPDTARMKTAIQKGVEWVLSMRNHDGGWGAFDKNNDRAVLTRVPFADHNAIIDPSTPDLTARALECLGHFGYSPSHPAIRSAVDYLRREQTAEGAWYGRWGVNYVYGTSGVLRALESVGLQRTDFARRGAAWLRSVQNADGGFGESIASYDDPSLKGKGESTASQTAWGLIGLLAAGEPSDLAAARAARYLIDRQKPDGSWDEDLWTGTGFPRVFYLKYHLYPVSFPLYALARYRNQAAD